MLLVSTPMVNLTSNLRWVEIQRVGISNPIKLISISSHCLHATNSNQILKGVYLYCLYIYLNDFNLQASKLTNICANGQNIINIDGCRPHHFCMCVYIYIYLWCAWFGSSKECGWLLEQNCVWQPVISATLVRQCRKDFHMRRQFVVSAHVSV